MRNPRKSVLSDAHEQTEDTSSKSVSNEEQKSIRNELFNNTSDNHAPNIDVDENDKTVPTNDHQWEEDKREQSHLSKGSSLVTRWQSSGAIDTPELTGNGSPPRSSESSVLHELKIERETSSSNLPDDGEDVLGHCRRQERNSDAVFDQGIPDQGISKVEYTAEAETLPEGPDFDSTFQNALKSAVGLSRTVYNGLCELSLARSTDYSLHKIMNTAKNLQNFASPVSRTIGIVGDTGNGTI